MFSISPFTGRRARHIEAGLLCAATLTCIAGALSLDASLTQSARLRALERMERRNITAQEADYAKAAPVRLRVPKIGVNAPVLPVGLRPDGLMDIPSTPDEIGWFSLGFVPGQPGNAVMAGHLDKASGEPAVFWELRRLKIGDTVEVETADDGVRRFRVVKTASYPADQAPMEELFGTATGSRLHLVTCNGEWQRELLTYNRRLVVTTEEIR